MLRSQRYSIQLSNYTIIAGLLLLLYSCNRLESVEDSPDANKHLEVDSSNISENSSIKIVEEIKDSLNVGNPGKFKINIIKYDIYNDQYILVKFYQKQDEWHLKNEYHFNTQSTDSLNLVFMDYNNDGYNDISFTSVTAARGANEVRRLFVVDKKTDQLISIRNSEEYPNLSYNASLNCISAYAFYGGSTSYFLKIKGDSLKKIADVTLFDGLTISTYSENGDQTEIYRDTSVRRSNDIFESFEVNDVLRQIKKH
ncbi:XAC2610-related protein [Lewinella sp. IMCC34191]|uniref:XAC2610-related protein n=1 Tax=Lewinella sp. IMCC34191 TaxID=2259172 RepID=UPI00130040A2|nr:hypothetical protein [Lewinella sp. IMCC34191]